MKHQEECLNEEIINTLDQNIIEREIIYGSEKSSPANSQLVRTLENPDDFGTYGYSDETRTYRYRTSGYSSNTVTASSLGVSTNSNGTCASIMYTDEINKPRFLKFNNQGRMNENNEKLKKQIIDHDLPIITGNGDFKVSSNKMRHFDTNIFYSSECCAVNDDEEERKGEGMFIIYVYIYGYIYTYIYIYIYI
jgi:hypothetical protein